MIAKRIVEICPAAMADHELIIEETFGFSNALRIAFCEGDELSHGSKIFLLGMRCEDELMTYGMIEVLRLRREMLTN